MKFAIADSPAAQQGPALYTSEDLAQILSVPSETVARWVRQRLLEPCAAKPARFDFRQLSIAQTLSEMTARGASLKKLRKGVERLRQWLPKSAPTHLPAPDGSVYVRLDGGELAASDGQLCIEFADGTAPLQLGPRVMRSPRQWYAFGLEQEIDGDVPAAVTSYRQALIAGGPDAEICFSLAHALASLGEHAAAAERYRQVIELDSQNGDAWNNLGVALCACNRSRDACAAFQRAVEFKPHDPGPRYNLADAFDDAGRTDDAARHSREYLQYDQTSERAAYARRRLAAV